MHEIPWTSVKKVFFLNLIGNTLGDNLVKLPLLAVTKRFLPHAQISMTVSPNSVDVFKHSPHLDNLIPLEELRSIGDPNLGMLEKRYRYFLLMRKVVKILRELKPDVCFVLEPHFAPSQLIPFIARVPYRVGYLYQGCYFSWTLSHATQFRGAYDTGEVGYHVRDANLDILRCVGITVRDDDKVMRKVVSQVDRDWAEQYFKKNNIGNNDIVVAFQAGAKMIERAWPTDRFAAVASHLVKKYRAKILLIGSPSEKPINDMIASACGNAILVAGESLDHVSAILERCTLAFGNDSGIMHLASAVGTTPVVIFGMMTAKHFHPCGPGGYIGIEGPGLDKVILFGEVELIKERMRKVTVKQAIVVMDKVLKKVRRHPVIQAKHRNSVHG